MATMVNAGYFANNIHLKPSNAITVNMNLQTNNIKLLKRQTQTRTYSSNELLKDAENLRTEGSEYLYCVSCRTRITQTLFQVTINGSFEHFFINPAGIEFHIACFSEINNCATKGIPTPQDTWFPGYYWQVLACGWCDLQLGWEFTGDDTFYGLIVPRLTLGSL